MRHGCIPRLSCVHCHCIKELEFPLSMSMSMSKKRKQVNRVLFKALLSSLARKTGSSVTLVAQLSPWNAPQRSEEWFSLRKDRLTTSTFSTALGLWKGTRRAELWHEKVFTSSDDDDDTRSVNSLRAMEWGVINEAAAIERYKSITGNQVSSLGFAVHSEERLYWLGASPDGLLDDAGILEVKCPFNKGKPELGLPWSKMPFYYMPQIQGQMEIVDREWVDLYCWTPNGSTLFRVYRDRVYWNLIHGVLREFWWENVVPAREAVLIGDQDKAILYKPASTHKRTPQVIANSINLAARAKMLCREIAGHVEFYR